MDGMKRSGSRIGIIAGVLLVAGIAVITGLLLQSRQVPLAPGEIEREPRRKMPDSGADSGADRPKPAALIAAESERLAHDQLIALCEKEGPAAALAAAKALTGKDRERALMSLFHHLGRVDPEFTARELKGAGLSEFLQGCAIDAIMRSWTDGEKALAWATSEFTGDRRKFAVGQALRILVRTDSQAALAYLDAMPESNSRRQALTDLLVSWGGHDPKAALGYLENHLTSGEEASATDLVVGAWARSSPLDALAWVGTIQNEASSARLLHEVAMNWYAVSPAEASAWLATQPDSPVKAGIIEGIAERERHTINCGPIQQLDLSWKDKPVAEMAVADFRNWAYQDPAGARKYLEHSPQGIDLSELSTTLAAGISAEEGPAAAFEWARQLPGESGTAALRLAVISWTGTDPAAAAEKIATVVPEQRTVLASALAENWTGKDPAAAAAWAARYPGSDQKSLVRTVLQTWSGLDPHEAYEWLGSLPAGESRDEGISYMIVREAPSDPKSLVPWIEMMSTPELREQKRKQLDGYLKVPSAE